MMIGEDDAVFCEGVDSRHHAGRDVVGPQAVQHDEELAARLGRADPRDGEAARRDSNSNDAGSKSEPGTM